MSTNVGEIDLRLLLNSDKFSSQLKTVDTQAEKASSKISSTMSKIGKAVAVAFSVTAIVKFGKECLNVATETSNAWIGLNSILTGQGKSFEQAQNFINDYITDGLVPLNNAVTAYKNLAARGYSSDQIQKTMIALKNAATFGRQSTYSLGEAVQTASEGLKNENSILVDNAGVTKNVAKMWEDYAKSIGKSTNQLTQQEKIQAEVNGILEETKFQMNDATVYTNTYSGKLAMLSQAFTNMKTAIGNVIQPIAKVFVPIVTAAVNAVTKLFTALSGIMSLFGLKADSVKTVSAGIGDIATKAEDTSSAIDGIGDSAKKTAKQLNNLASFDNLNVLSKGNDSSGGSGGSSGENSGGTSGLTDTLDVTSVIEEDTTAFDGFLSRVKELADIFKKGFDISFGDINFDTIKKHLNGIKEAIISIWTDPEVSNAANNWANNLSYVLGQVVGSIAKIGVNIAEAFLGSIEKYLSKNSERVKFFITDIFNISSKDIALTGNLFQAIGEISNVFKSDTFKQIGANIVTMFTNALMSVIEIFMKFVTDIRAVFIQPIIDNIDKIKVALQSLIDTANIITGILADAFTYVGDKWNEVYDNNIHPLMESLKKGISDTFSKFLDAYNKYVAPAIERIANKLKELWEQHLKPLVGKVADFCGSIYDLIKALWENILKPVIDWCIENILPVLVPIFEGVWNTITTVFGYIADAVGGLIDIFRGLIEFIVGIFTGDWNRAWEGIKTFFGGIWDAIKGILQAVWSAIIGIIEICTNNVKGIIQTVFNAVKTVITNIWNGISTFLSNIWNEIKTIATNVFNSIKTSITNILNNIKTTCTNIWNNIKTIITNTINNIKTTIANIVNNIKTTVTNVFNTIKTNISNTLNGVKSTVSGIWNNIKISINNAVTNIKNGITNQFQTAYNNIKNIFNNIASFFSGIWNKVKNTFSSLGTKIGDSISGAVKSGINGVLGMIENVVNRFVSMINGAIGIINNIPGVNIGGLSKLKLPRLAEGGYVKANTPQLAMIGDNKHQGEVVAPEDKMLDMVLTALKMFKEQDNTNNGRSQGNTIAINFSGSLAQLIRVLKPELDKENKRKGDKLIVGGAT